MSPRELARFDAKWMPEPMTGCWLWLGATHPRWGHGSFHVNAERGVIGAHVASYEHAHGPVPAGLVLDHYACDTPQCVNPDHLRPTTNVANVMRGRSFAAENARKDQCANGHPFDDDNTYRRAGRRTCRACNRSAAAAYQQRCALRRKEGAA